MIGQTKAPVREGTELFDAQGNKIGIVTSGTAGPTADKPVSMAYVSTEHAALGGEVFADVRGKMLPMTVEKCLLCLSVIIAEHNFFSVILMSNAY